MGQSSTNTSDLKTVEDFNAQKALYAAQADAADAQTRMLASQKALTVAQASPDPVAAQLTAATQAANLAAQRKALADSNSAILKDQYTIPDASYTGSISVGDKAGTIQGQILAAAAVDSAASRIAQRLPHSMKVVVSGLSDLPDFQALISFTTQYESVKSLLDNAAEKIAAARVGLSIPHTESPVAIAGAVLGAANKFLGYLGTDYAIQGITVTPDDLMLVTAVAEQLRANGNTVTIPAVYNALALREDNPVLSKMKTLTQTRVFLQATADASSTDVDSLSKAAAIAQEPAKSTMVAQGSKLKAAVDQTKVAISLYDGLITKLTTPDDKAKIPLTAIIQQDSIHSAVKGGKLLVVKVSAAGGTYYTRKNLWSFFGAMPFFTMGGVVVNYSLFDGESGVVLSSGLVPVDGGFYKVGKLPTKFRAQR